MTSKELQPSKLVEDNLKALQEHLDGATMEGSGRSRGSADTGGVGGASGVDEAPRLN